CFLPLRSTRTSAWERRSENSFRRARSRSTARWASSGIALRGGGKAVAQPPASQRISSALGRSLRAFTPEALQTGDGLVELLLPPVGRRVELEGPFPRADRFLLEPVLGEGIAQVIVDDRVGLAGLLDRASQLLESLGIAPLLVVRPAQAVDEVAVVGLELERLADELQRLVEVLALLHVHLTHVV